MTQVQTVIGIDLGDDYSYLHELELGSGETVGKRRLSTTKLGLTERFETLPRSRVVIEAGLHSPWVSHLLEDLGHEVIVANPNTVALIYGGHRKNDALDAEKLARLARADATLLSPIKHRSQHVQADRARLKARSVMVSVRTQLINHVRGLVKSFGAKVPKCSTESFHKFAPAAVPCELKPATAPLLRSIAQLTKDIKALNRELEQLAKTRYPETQLLKQVPGVGPLLSLAFVLTLESPKRFTKSRDVAAYLGLVPKQRQSGGKDPNLGISKRGDRLLRHLLIQGAHYILGPSGPDSDLRRFGLQLAERGGGGAKQRAVVAVARKLAVLMHRLWVTGEVYDPRHQAKQLQQVA